MYRLKKIGTIRAVHSSEVRHSTLGLGFEKLDRAVFEPEKAYDKVAALGVKWARIQSGWARTEKEKGVYDFAWLDSIVDNLVSRGITPWMCLCYGNGIYDEEAARIFGAVGCPPIKNDEQKKAWHDYVATTVKRYAGKVSLFEIWNEPDGQWCWKHGVSGTEYGSFVIDTARAIKEGNPEAAVVGGVSCGHSFVWVQDVIATGAVKVMDYYSYHGYSPNEYASVQGPHALRSLLLKHNPDLKFIQGETGTQSRGDGAGALKGMAWTPQRQAKFLARIILKHMFENVTVNSYFSCVDMIEALRGFVNDKSSYLDYGYFGVLGAEFDEDGVATGEYKPKPSYRTLQVLASVFREEYVMEELVVKLFSEPSPTRGHDELWWENIISQGFVKPNGSKAYVYWKSVPLLKSTLESTISIQIADVQGTPRLVDLLDGTVYEIPDSIMKQDRNGVITFDHLPLKDSPLLLTFGDFADIVPLN